MDVYISIVIFHRYNQRYVDHTNFETSNLLILTLDSISTLISFFLEKMCLLMQYVRPYIRTSLDFVKLGSKLSINLFEICIYLE